MGVLVFIIWVHPYSMTCTQIWSQRMAIKERPLSYSRQAVSASYINTSTNDPLYPDLHTLSSKKICVMGGCGQVGSHILATLYEFGFPIEQLYVNDDLRLGQRENLPEPLRERVDTQTHLEFAHNPPFTPDVVIFVGGRSSAPHFQELQDVMEELETWKVILEWCTAQNIRLIFASTSSLCKERPSVESQRVWPGSLYELTKLTMEEMAIQQALCDRLSVQICRFFSVYGVTEQHKGDIGNLYTQILWHAIARQPFEVWGQTGHFRPGEQTRDIIFAPEVSRALLHLLTLPDPQPTINDISALIYNIGQGQPFSVREMIRHVAELLPSTLQPIIVETEVPANIKNYVVHTWGNPQKLLQTGFQPIFTDHTMNLHFIFHALSSDLDWYWSVVEEIRQHRLAP